MGLTDRLTKSRNAQIKIAGRLIKKINEHTTGLHTEYLDAATIKQKRL